MINTEWESRRRQLKEDLQFGLLMPLYIATWIICVVAVMILEVIWRIERRTRK